MTPSGLSLCLGLGNGKTPAASGFSFSDSDAEAYVAAVETAGASPTDDQKSAIDTFYASAKSNGYYTSLKRLYLPIWAAAAPNAIDMIALGSGTFNGGVTHAAGYVEGNGTTGYFDTGNTATAKGLSDASCSLGFIAAGTFNGSSGFEMGADDGSSKSLILGLFSNFMFSSVAGQADLGFFTLAKGIYMTGRESGRIRLHFRNTASGFTTPSDDANTAGNIPTAQNDRYMGIGAASPSYDTTQMGAAFWGTGFTAAQAEDFSSDLQTMWEALTGITL